jgi:hypothetical protein
MAKRIYVRRRLVESQGVDDEIIKLTKEISKAVVDELRKYRGIRGVFRSDPRLDYRLYRNVTLNTDVNMKGKRAVVKYAVTVTVCFDSDMQSGNTSGTCARLPGVAESVMRDDMKERDPSHYELPEDMPIFEVKINLYGCVSKPGSKFGMDVSLPALEDTLSHELMHAKSCFREMMEGKAKGTEDMSSSMRAEDVENVFGFIKYFLSPNEMKSYVTGLYSEVRKLTEQRRRPPEPGELKDMILNTQTWRQFRKVRGYLDEYAGPRRGEWDAQAEEFLKDADTDTAQLKKMTGVSTPDDLMRYMRKASRDMELRLAKAAYKGYKDAIAERNKR